MFLINDLTSVISPSSAPLWRIVRAAFFGVSAELIEMEVDKFTPLLRQ